MTCGSSAPDGRVNQGEIRRWNGTAWSAVGTGTTALLATASLRGIWGSGPNDVWIVGLGGDILHWNGSALSAVASGTTEPFNAIWGSGPNDIWAVGFNGTIVHWAGTSWSVVPSVRIVANLVT